MSNVHSHKKKQNFIPETSELNRIKLYSNLNCW